MFKKILYVSLILFFAATSLYAVETGGVDVPDTMSLEGGKGELVLNGTGIRKKFGFKVYVAGLYLKAKTSDSQQIITADEPMAITMIWKRTGPVDKVTGVFNDGFKYSAGETYDAQKANIDKFLGSVSKAEKTDVWKYIYTPGEGTAIYYNDQLSTTIEGLDFKKALFGVWLLETDVFDGDKELRDGMLGK
ncbi:conserved exported hypothetical protein [Desulfamplus magnetovallimortis]|uniref:Chalcone isomerase domain-containing protein n=1 Tax=Desulfamplus magnetovallimortis TaxID=1246637 RepID=A0A1W1HH56_9BACT|nr:chalcone isomerase family protein [Desulfamplus magnetovallimortis]SLM31837.1 conserved exported hypothetical protein [Desulfamplus magnetovallimortis]